MHEVLKYDHHFPMAKKKHMRRKVMIQGAYWAHKLVGGFNPFEKY